MFDKEDWSEVKRFAKMAKVRKVNVVNVADSFKPNQTNQTKQQLNISSIYRRVAGMDVAKSSANLKCRLKPWRFWTIATKTFNVKRVDRKTIVCMRKCEASAVFVSGYEYASSKSLPGSTLSSSIRTTVKIINSMSNTGSTMDRVQEENATFFGFN